MMKNGNLVVRQLEVGDSGTYVCTARNAAGTTNIPVVLQVNGECSLCTAHSPIIVRLGYKVQLGWHA